MGTVHAENEIPLLEIRHLHGCLCTVATRGTLCHLRLAILRYGDGEALWRRNIMPHNYKDPWYYVKKKRRHHRQHSAM